MGNELSTEINHVQANFADIKIQNGELNGHAVQSSEESEPVACKDVQQQKCEIPPAKDTNKPKPSAGKEEVDKAKEPAKIEASTETETTTTTEEEPPKEVQKQSENDRKNIFGKMFKKKAEPVKPADSVDGEVTLDSVREEVDKAKEPAKIEASTETETTTTTEEEPPKEVQKQIENERKNPFGKMFKKKAEPVKPASECKDSVDGEVTLDSVRPSADKEEVDKAKEPAKIEASSVAETTTTTEEEPPKEVQKQSENERKNIFGKMFKKKAEPVKPADSVDGEVTLDSEAVAIEASAEPEGIADELLKDLGEVAEETSQSEEPKESEKKVMNFFKSFASSTKPSKEAKATSDASKDQSQKETPPAPSANVQEAPKAPPPPPPAPPKMEGKAEPAVKKEETSATAATKAADAPAKTKTKDGAFSKLFRPKPVAVEEIKPIEIVVEVETQVDASKTSTLEAAAKPEEPPAPKPEEKKQEEKKLEKKMSFWKVKPKVLLGQVTTRIQAATSSAAASISLGSPRSAPEPKKETPAAPVPESAPIAKAVEEPKPATLAVPDNKSVDSTDNASPSAPRKLEKRNSVNIFFKSLGQKRHSTDAGVQTDPVVPEKAK
ncbi:uncharacterized protein [Misgurnus anguillicaudatus]|uniref:uncharacterized protein isoform X2 n=1 Tax=Misgurnus anguillicaudatus TaxID=75329 RepID=UPI003CCF4EFC